MTKHHDTVGIITDTAKKVLSDVQQQCTEALKALDQADHLVALGAMIGLEEQIRSINARLLVLSEIDEIQKQNRPKGGPNDGSKERANP